VSIKTLPTLGDNLSNAVFFREDTPSSLHITHPKKEDAISETGPQDDIERRQEFEPKPDFGVLDMSSMSLSWTSLVTPHIGNAEPLELYHNQIPAEPNGDIDKHYLLPLLMSLMKSHAEVIQL
jgi:hypothetical protein